MDQPNAGQPSPAPRFIPGNFTTMRANVNSVEAIGGSFVLSFAELRTILDQTGTPVNGMVEVGRFEVNPMAMVTLLSKIVAAIRNYVEFYGPLPQITQGSATQQGPTVADILKHADDIIKGQGGPGAQPPATPA